MKKVLALQVVGGLVASLVLVGCGGGSDGPTTNPTPTPPATQKQLAGQLVLPQDPSAVAPKLAQLLSPTAVAAKMVAGCDVPDGYYPLAKFVIDLLDASGAKVGTLTTDECGLFNGLVANAVTNMKVAVNGYQPLTVGVSGFIAPTALASPVPNNAQLAISAIQYTGNGGLAFSVTDTKTNKAVLGLLQGAVSVSNKATGAALPLASFGAVQSSQDPASVMLVLDASGSMGASVTNTYTRFDLASAATHLFLDGKAADDEAGTIIFDSKVSLINDDFLKKQLFVDAANQPFAIGSSGFVKDAKPQRVVADFYNENNRIWGAGYKVAKHKDDAFTAKGYHPWGGSTALWAATDKGLDELVKRTSKRKLVIAMTDGEDNSSYPSTSATVVDKAKKAGIPVHMVAFGNAYSVDETTMKDVAQKTGGEYQRRENESIADLFTSMQTGIRHQYTSQLATPPAGGTVLLLKVNISGLTIEREVAAN